MAWIRYSAIFFLGPGLLGLAGALAMGRVGAMIGISVGIAAVFAGVGWSLRR